MTKIHRWNIKQRLKIKHKLYETSHNYHNAHSLCNFPLQFIFTDRCRSSVNSGGQLQASHFCWKIYAWKINKMPKFYLIFRDDRLWGSWVVAGSKFIFSHFDFAGRPLLTTISLCDCVSTWFLRKINKMPEFYVIFARKVFFWFFWGDAPVSCAYTCIF